MGVSTDGILFYGFEVYSEDCGLNKLGVFSEDLETEEYLDEITSGSSVGYGSHYSNSYPIYYLCTRQISVRRGAVKEVDVSEFTNLDADRALLKDFCTKHNIEWEEPKLYLASYWG